MTSKRSYSTLAFWACPIRQPSLVGGLAWRRIRLRFSGATLGWLWAVLIPLVMLAVYTFVFGTVFHRDWGSHLPETTNYAFHLYLVLVCYQFLADCIGRSPGRIPENRTFVKKIVFPLEALSWIAVLDALFSLLVNLCVLLVLNAIWFGAPGISVLQLPLALVPLVMLGLGVSWLFAAIGAYFRDLRQVSGLLVGLLLFATPIFYPLDAVPEPYRAMLLANPLTGIVDAARDILFLDGVESWPVVGMLWAGTTVFASLSHALFMRLRRGFADVV